LEIVKRVPRMRELARDLREPPGKVALVPTMGYLHEGHLTLVRRGREMADRVDGTAGAVAWCAAQRVDIQRVHDVKAMSRVVSVVDAIVRRPA